MQMSPDIVVYFCIGYKLYWKEDKHKDTCYIVTNAHSPLLIPVPLVAPLVPVEEPVPPADVVAPPNFGKPATETAYRWSQQQSKKTEGSALET